MTDAHPSLEAWGRSTGRRSAASAAEAAAPETQLSLLTPREIDCLRLVGRRRSSKQIADELRISKTSVDTYCDRARTKLKTSSRQEAARVLLRAERAGQPLGLIGASRAAKPRLRAIIRTAAVAFSSGGAALFAMAALLAGLHALDTMRPLPNPKAPMKSDVFRAYVHGVMANGGR